MSKKRTNKVEWNEPRIVWCTECNECCNFNIYSNGEVVCKKCDSRIATVGRWERE